MPFIHLTANHFERLILSLAQEFINIPLKHIENAIEKAMAIVGNYCEADRFTVYLYDWEKEIIYLRNEWVKEPQFRLKEELKQFALSGMSPGILERHSHGLAYVANNADSAENEKYYTDLKKTGAQITTSVPMMENGKAFGCCVLSRVSSKEEWGEAVISTVSIFCEMLVSVIKRIDYTKALQEKNESMRLILDSTRDAIIMVDREGKILNLNKEFSRRFENFSSCFINLNMNELLPVSKYDDLCAQRRKKMAKVFDTGLPEYFEDTRDGYWFLNRIYPVFKESEIYAVTFFSTDITAGKRLEQEERKIMEMQIKAEEMRKKEEEYLEILDGSSEGNYVVDFEKGVTKYSENWLKRLGLEGVPPEKLLDAVHKRMLPEEAEASMQIRNVLKKSKAPKINRELRMKDKAGSLMWVMVQGKLIYNESGELAKAYGSFIDITERKEMELQYKRQVEEQKEKNRLTTEFFTSISHEFKTPISVMLLQIELMNLYKNDPKKLDESITALSQNTYRLSRLVTNLLDISKYDAGYMKLYLTKVDMVELLKNIVLSVSAYAEAKSVKTLFCSALPQKIMLTDVDKTERTMLNLLSNAIKHTGPGERIKVCLRLKNDSHIEILVADTGEGIPKNMLDKIFDRFVQVDTCFSRKNEGCGIGLSIVKAFVTLLGGEINVKSKMGAGSLFKITLPVIRSELIHDPILMEGIDLKKKTEMEFAGIINH